MWGKVIENQVVTEPHITKLERVTTLYLWALDLNYWHDIFENQEVGVIKVDYIIPIMSWGMSLPLTRLAS